MGVFCVLGDGIQSAMYGEWHGGDIVCRLLRFCKVVTIIASNNILIGMSLDRFLAIKYPLNVVRVGKLIKFTSEVYYHLNFSL